jgi:hypothetical protein
MYELSQPAGVGQPYLESRVRFSPMVRPDDPNKLPEFAETATENTSVSAGADNARESSSHRAAARFSCYASLAVHILVSWWLWWTHGVRQGDMDMEGCVLMACTLTLVVAFARGITGLIGGLHHRAVGSMVFAAIGLLLSGGPLAWLVYCAFTFR